MTIAGSENFGLIQIISNKNHSKVIELLMNLMHIRRWIHYVNKFKP